jgi:hypothetical protein
VYGEAQGCFQHLFLLHAHAEGEQQARDVARQVARELHPSAVDEQVDDGEIEVLPARGGHGLGSGGGELHAVALAAQEHGQGTATRGVTIDEEDGSHLGRGSSKPHTICQR